MGQCNCITTFNISYFKYTYFWEPDLEYNRDVYAAIEQDFSDWVRTEEYILRNKEYDQSYLTTYTCNMKSSDSLCTCLFYKKKFYRDIEADLEDLNKDPEPAPNSHNGQLGTPFNIQGTCNCTVTDMGASYTEIPDALKVQQEVVTVKDFVISPKYSLTATEILANGCQGNVPFHLKYFELPFPINITKEGPAVLLRYKLKRQITPWVRTYTNDHIC